MTAKVEVIPKEEAKEDKPPAVTIKDGVATIVDARGRAIEVKRLNVLQSMRLFKVVGAESAANEQYMLYARVAASVQSCGGNPMGFPGSLLQLESHVQLLDEPGFEAAIKGLNALAPSQEETAEHVKNS